MSFDAFCDFHRKWGEPKYVLTSVIMKVTGAARVSYRAKTTMIINISVSFDTAFI